MSSALRIGMIGGGGWLGGAIVRSILTAQLTSPERLTLSSRRDPPPDFPRVSWTRDNQELVDEFPDKLIVGRVGGQTAHWLREHACTGTGRSGKKLSWDAAGTNVRYLVPVAPKRPVPCRPAQAEERPGGRAPVAAVPGLFSCPRKRTKSACDRSSRTENAAWWRDYSDTAVTRVTLQSGIWFPERVHKMCIRPERHDQQITVLQFEGNDPFLQAEEEDTDIFDHLVQSSQMPVRQGG